MIRQALLNKSATIIPLFRQGTFDEIPNLIAADLGFSAADEKWGQFVPEF